MKDLRQRLAKIRNYLVDTGQVYLAEDVCKLQKEIPAETFAIVTESEWNHAVNLGDHCAMNMVQLKIRESHPKPKRKQYIFTETGEVRKACDEWFKGERGVCLYSDGATAGEYPILTREELEVEG